MGFKYRMAAVGGGGIGSVTVAIALLYISLSDSRLRTIFRREVNRLILKSSELTKELS